jgi:hypothetical protein
VASIFRPLWSSFHGLHISASSIFFSWPPSFGLSNLLLWPPYFGLFSLLFVASIFWSLNSASLVASVFWPLRFSLVASIFRPPS